MIMVRFDKEGGRCLDEGGYVGFAWQINGQTIYPHRREANTMPNKATISRLLRLQVVEQK